MKSHGQISVSVKFIFVCGRDGASKATSRILFDYAIHYLRDVHNLNYCSGYSCLSVCMFHLESRRTDFDEIWYVCYVIEGNLALALFNFLQSILI
jgi:hypothetical protein